MSAMLYLVPTPIGNLGDISKRARETLERADFIAAEDTRVTLKLLNHLELKKPLVSYYEHNKSFKGEKILDRILAGETCALVSDAGSPAISDPGEDLVKQCAASGIPVCAIPGPCAAITALSISGQATGRFCFEGFLSTAKKSRREGSASRFLSLFRRAFPGCRRQRARSAAARPAAIRHCGGRFLLP